MPEVVRRRLGEQSGAVRNTIRLCLSRRNGDPVLSRILLTLVLSLAFGTLYAQEEPVPEQAAQDQNEPAAAGGGFLQAPTVEPSPVTGDPAEPDITITESGDEVVYEYRVRGVLYMVKVQPQLGPPYYLYDLNGDGMIDVDDRSSRNTAIPQWVLFQWH